MNKLNTLCIVLLMFTLQSIALTSIYAAEREGIEAPRRIPSPPPTPPAPCPPPPPGVDIDQTCKSPTLDELRIKYLETEGTDNRGLNFYFIAAAFFDQHRFYRTTTVNQANFSFNTKTMVETLGPPDYRKTLIKDSETMELFAYVFTNKSKRDSVMIVYTANGLIYRNGYSETSFIIDDSWEKVK